MTTTDEDEKIDGAPLSLLRLYADARRAGRREIEWGVTWTPAQLEAVGGDW